ncbi:hypothetical protein TNCV_423981 [Trichonephila clavipes]|nr:hypothetical protein TNCV_423981 [Trichonephila clavipes]
MFQDDNTYSPMSLCTKTWSHESDDKVEHLTWCPHSPDVNIIVILWGVFENNVFILLPLPFTLSELETALHEERVPIS